MKDFEVAAGATGNSKVSQLAVRIVQVSMADQVATARTLFKEYAAWLGIDLSFQKFDDELANLPGDYAPPDGRLLLAQCGTETAGCVALRRFNDGACEMKRMWVRPQFRGMQIGRVLAEHLIAEARSVGYGEMLLDSLPALISALSLYKSLGFESIPAYRYNPEPDAVFMRLRLQ
jgi:GNAT superfamily N-acetyltransferase